MGLSGVICTACCRKTRVDAEEHTHSLNKGIRTGVGPGTEPHDVEAPVPWLFGEMGAAGCLRLEELTFLRWLCNGVIMKKK